MSLEAPYFSSPCLTPKRKSWILVRRLYRRESVTKTAHQMLFVHWLTKITNDHIVQGACPISVVRVGSNEDCGNRVPCVDQMSVEFDPGHGRHMDVSDQAGRFDEMRRCEEIGSRRESLDGVAQRLHEASHGIPKQPIIFNDRDQRRFWHAAFRRFASSRHTGGPQQYRRFRMRNP